MTSAQKILREEVRKRPEGMPIAHQDWRSLLFLHWEYPVEKIQSTLPPGLYVDTFNNKGFISIVPFMIRDLRIANLPGIPGLSDFIEVNVRTYVIDKNGIPGVWFYSLDLNSLVGTTIARNTFALPYFFANLTEEIISSKITLEGSRISDPKIQMHFSYSPKKEPETYAVEGSLDYFLVERYVRFSFSTNQLHLARIYHKPYALKGLDFIEFTHTLDRPNGFVLPKEPDYAHYSSGVDVDIFPLKQDVIYNADFTNIDPSSVNP